MRLNDGVHPQQAQPRATSEGSASTLTTNSITTAGLDEPWDGRSVASSSCHKLYDREDQSQELADAYQRCCSCDGTSELVLVTGASGTGKSALARSIHSLVQADGGFLIQGKFEDHGGRSHGPFLDAVEDFVVQLVAQSTCSKREGKEEGGEEDSIRTKLGRAIQEVVGSELFVLQKAIPTLNQIWDEHTNGTMDSREQQEQQVPTNSSETALAGVHVAHEGSFSSKHLSGPRRLDRTTSVTTFDVGVADDNPARFVAVFCRLIQAMASCDIPIVILLDDLQWADPPSLEILKSLLEESDPRQPLMLLGTCRGNEVHIHDGLAVMLRQLEATNTAITDIQVQNVSEVATAHMMADLLSHHHRHHHPSDDDDSTTRHQFMPLAQVVNSTTQGNVFFVRQYVQTLLDERVLFKDVETQQWTWDEAALVLHMPDYSDHSDDESARSNTTGNGKLIIQLLARKLLKLPEHVIETMKTAACLGSTFQETILFHANTIPASLLVQALHVVSKEGFISHNVHIGMGQFKHDKFREAALSLIPDDEQQQRAQYYLAVGRNLRKQLSVAMVKANCILIVNQLKHGLDFVMDPDERDDFARLFLRASKESAKTSAFVAASQYTDYGIGLLSHRHWRDQYNLSLELFTAGTELAYCIGDMGKLETLVEQVRQNARSIGDKTRVLATQIMAYCGKGEPTSGLNLCYDTLQELKEPSPRYTGEVGVIIELVRVRIAMGNKTEEDILALPVLEDPRIIAALKLLYIMFNLLESAGWKAAPCPIFRLVRLTLKHGLSPLAGLGFVFYGVSLIKLGYIEDGYRAGELASKILERFPSKQLEGHVKWLCYGVIKASKYSYRQVLEPWGRYGTVSMETGHTEMAVASITIKGCLQLFMGDPIPDIAKVLARYVNMCRKCGQNKVGSLGECILQTCHNLQGLAQDPLTLTGDIIDERETIEQLIAEDLGGVLIILLSCKGLSAAALARDSSGWARRKKIAEARRQAKKLEKLLMHNPETAANKKILIDAELDYTEGRYFSALLKYDRSIAYAEREGFVSDQAIAFEKAGRMLLQTGQNVKAMEYLEQARLLYLSWGAQVKVNDIERLILVPKY
ncbi:multi-sensor signal transduction multi-kinase [Seminavis robusta]|uniref:Multi-sensor signal transduction multi-kinase n=1 Tax=Seminavis robusta TaxID=568900 RepID=A0A9N8DY41_9STRA|nr:multi-sensor signal transduction multi-kinase [Seminavis robusta]|eukprot:Sro437_g142870.1 multi-sensor signal transduction multi-kinase (1094) ;mRNA; f:46446-49884